jgi:hypothetical protein
MFLLSEASILSPVHWISEALSPEENWPGCEAGALPPSSAEVKNEWSYMSAPPVCLRDVYRDCT